MTPMAMEQDHDQARPRDRRWKLGWLSRAWFGAGALLALGGCPDPLPGPDGGDLREPSVTVRLAVKDLPMKGTEEWEAYLYINDQQRTTLNRRAVGKTRDEISFAVTGPYEGTWRLKVRAVSVEDCLRFSTYSQEVSQQVAGDATSLDFGVTLAGGQRVREGESDVRLNLEVDGEGAGKLQVSRPGPLPQPIILCEGSAGCSGSVRCNETVEIKAVPDLKNSFTGFSMPCGSSNPCQYAFSSSTTVKVLFGKKECRNGFCIDQTGGGYELNSVFGFADNDVHAVGTGGTILYRDDLSWKNSPPASGDLMAVWGSAGTIWAVGDKGLTMERLRGANWVTAKTGLPYRLQALWARKVNDLYAAGSGGNVVRGNPYSAAQVAVDAGVSWSGIWGAEGDGPWVVGGRSGLGVIARAEAGGFVQETAPTMATLNAVWGRRVGADLDMWVVGDRGTIWHRHNGAWMDESVGGVEALRGLWGDAGSVWAVGDKGVVWRRGYEAGQWVRMTDAQQLSQQDLRGVWGDGKGTVFMVGAAGTILSYR